MSNLIPNRRPKKRTEKQWNLFRFEDGRRKFVESVVTSSDVWANELEALLKAAGYDAGIRAEAAPWTPAGRELQGRRLNPSRRKNPSTGNKYNPIYNTRVTLRGYNGKQSVFSAHGTDKGKIVKKLFPTYSKPEHLTISHDYKLASTKAGNFYSHALDQAAMRLWGRPFRPTDYRISGIGSDEFSQRDKTLLRELVNEKQAFADISLAHYYAAFPRGKAGKWRLP